MKRIRSVALICILCVVLTSCAERKAGRQFTSCDYLHAVGTSVLNKNNEPIILKAKKIDCKDAETALTDVQNALQQSEINMLRVCLSGEWLTDWKLSKEAQTLLTSVASACKQQNKYFSVAFYEYPESYNAWNSDSNFEENFCILWKETASLLKNESSLAGYELSGVPHAGTTDERTALQSLEKMLQSAVDSLRSEDSQHMVMLGALYPILEDDAYSGLPFLKDKNFMYISYLSEFEFYTDQTHLSEQEIPDNLCYPNYYWRNVDGSYVHRAEGQQINYSSQDWQTLESEIYQAEADHLYCNIGAMVVPEPEVGGGELRIRSMRLIECDENGTEIATLYKADSTVGLPFCYTTGSGEYGQGSVYEDGTAYLESVFESTNFFADQLNIPLVKDKYYKLIVSMKQRGMNQKFECCPCIYVQTSETHDVFNMAYLEKYLGAVFAESKAVGVPVMIADVGVNEKTVTEQKGKDIYISEMLSVIQNAEQSYALR